jgi:hypothetical protein
VCVCVCERERERERVQMKNVKDLDHFIKSGLIVL